MKKRETFREVLCNIDDQVIVRDLLEHYVPEMVKDHIVSKFNEHVKRFNEWSDESMEDCECIPCFKGEDDE